ncbi:PorP/SprF family type IX secretion system membrane protein [Ferruginibacter sp. SUN002]|uniref:PorP/SprF family type IX secretion system membrane protein n=1 Tax=Ferruginibacter sp. SUN002 TaxID=2937789 RepID=UPI003D35B6D5
MIIRSSIKLLLYKSATPMRTHKGLLPGTKKIVPFVAMLCIVTNLFAQQKPHYTQYILNNYILNPALSGIENYTDVKISHRHQWVGINDAPVTTYLSIQGPLGKKDYKTNATTLFEMDGENPIGKGYWDNYGASAPHHGIGLQIVNDKAGPFNSFSIMGTYAYHIGINDKTNLSAGIGVGMNKYSIDPTKLFWGPDNPVDPSILNTTDDIGTAKLDMSAGLWLYSDRYFVGASAAQLTGQKIDFSDGALDTLEQGKKVPHFFMTAGYRFMLNEDINVLPSVMVKSVSPVPTQVDLNVKAMFRNAYWLGASYRGKYGFAAMAGLNVLNRFTVSYSYDYSTTAIHTVSNGTHEVIVGFILGNKYSDDTCPKNVW